MVGFCSTVQEFHSFFVLEISHVSRFQNSASKEKENKTFI